MTTLDDVVTNQVGQIGHASSTLGMGDDCRYLSSPEVTKMI